MRDYDTLTPVQRAWVDRSVALVVADVRDGVALPVGCQRPTVASRTLARCAHMSVWLAGIVECLADDALRGGSF